MIKTVKCNRKGVGYYPLKGECPENPKEADYVYCIRHDHWYDCEYLIETLPEESSTKCGFFLSGRVEIKTEVTGKLNIKGGG